MNKLNILWTNADPVTSELMVMMYAKASVQRKMWGKVRVIIWGATAKLVAENPKIRKLLLEAKEAGVEFSACQACAEELGVKQSLLDLEIEVDFMGPPLTEILKRNEHLLTI